MPLLSRPQAPKKKVAPPPAAVRKVRWRVVLLRRQRWRLLLRGCWFTLYPTRVQAAAPKKETNPLFEKRPKNFGAAPNATQQHAVGRRRSLAAPDAALWRSVLPR